jgi:hypothetical protein
VATRPDRLFFGEAPPLPDYDVDDIAKEAIEGIEALGVIKGVLVAFDPADPPEVHILYSNAAAADLVPLLHAVLAQLEAGVLRLPVEGGVRWSSDADPA